MGLPDDDESPFQNDAPQGVNHPIVPLSTAVGTWKIIIVDDEREVHDVTVLALRNVSFANRTLHFLSARSGAEARAVLAQHPDVALVLLDVVMEAEDTGLALVRYIRESLRNEQCRIVLRTGQPGSAPESHVIRHYDISDYRTKIELTSTRLYTTVIAALRTYQQLLAITEQREQLARAYVEQQQALAEIEQLKSALERERDYLREEVDSTLHLDAGMLGSSPAFTTMLEAIRAVAPTGATVLVQGESGVGKELVARQVHALSPRASGPLVKVNCASVPRELFESEFFGHLRGSFTGAHRDRVGRFQLASGGTLFLDEVGEIPLELQSKLLRALQEREVERVGAEKTEKVDVRLVAATNRDLKAMVDAGTFRADLYYRLVVFPIAVPPLRERPDDIVPLFEHYLAAAMQRLGRRFVPLAPTAIDALLRYPWPGNVRELENVVERAAILAVDGVLRLDGVLPDDLANEALEPRATRSASSTTGAERGYYTVDELRALERDNLIAVLERAAGKVAGPGGAAELFGVKPSTLTYQLKSLGISRS